MIWRVLHCRGTTWPSVLKVFFSLLYWPAHIGGRQRRFWRGRLVKVILLIQAHRNASLWPTLPAEPASCPVYGFVSFRAPLYRDFYGIMIRAGSPGCLGPWSGHEESRSGPCAAKAPQASIQTHPLHSAVNITNSWWRAT